MALVVDSGLGDSGRGCSERWFLIGVFAALCDAVCSMRKVTLGLFGGVDAPSAGRLIMPSEVSLVGLG